MASKEKGKRGNVGKERKEKGNKDRKEMGKRRIGRKRIR